ncbi:MAG: hypothetical protein ACYDA2_10445 [Acidimicrobiales bacterium]
MPTSLAAIPVHVTYGLVGNYVGFAAQLTATSTGLPIPGQTVTFTVNGPGGFPCAGTTDADGWARCSVNLVGAAQMAASSSYTAVFAGTTRYGASTSTASISDA